MRNLPPYRPQGRSIEVSRMFATEYNSQNDPRERTQLAPSCPGCLPMAMAPSGTVRATQPQRHQVLLHQKAARPGRHGANHSGPSLSPPPSVPVPLVLIQFHSDNLFLTLHTGFSPGCTTPSLPTAFASGFLKVSWLHSVRNYGLPSRL